MISSLSQWSRTSEIDTDDDADYELSYEEGYQGTISSSNYINFWCVGGYCLIINGVCGTY